MLRELRLEDAPFMLEWMHSRDIVRYLDADFMSMSIDDCIRFITESRAGSGIHYAVADESGGYLGTASLKHIRDKTAEFAIVLRNRAHGTGYAAASMRDMLRMGFCSIGLDYIYWYVSVQNQRAVRFYDKNGFHRVAASDAGKIAGQCFRENKEYIWYMEDGARYRKNHEMQKLYKKNR